MKSVLCLLPLYALLLVLTGCGPGGSSDAKVVVYCSLDSEFSAPLLDGYEATSGVRVLENFDTESTKTVGLYNRIYAERNRPRCDVFWNNEIVNTLRLQKHGLLEDYVSPAAANFPNQYKSPTGHWHGLAARARVLIVNTQQLPNREEWPGSVEDLADPKWKGKCGIAKPLAGTTATHATVLSVRWGRERFEKFFSDVATNAKVLKGNKQVALAVGRGQLAFGLTDTDDAIIEQDNGQPVEIVFPDQQADGAGTLFIPNTVCIIKGGPNPEQAKRFVDYVLRPEIETQLAKGSSAQFPVNPDVPELSRAMPDHAIRWMKVDFEKAAEQWDDATRFLREKFNAGG